MKIKILVQVLIKIIQQLVSGITGGGQSAPDIFHREIFADLLRKIGQGREGGKKKGQWRGKFEREEVENFYGRGKDMKMSRGPLFLFFFCHFLKQPKFVWGPTKTDNFTGKNHISQREKIGKLTLPSLKNIPFMPRAAFNIIHIWSVNFMQHYVLYLVKCTA